MDIQTFIQNFKEAFGENAELPLVFWYSDEQLSLIHISEPTRH